MRALVCHAPLDLRLNAFAAEAPGSQQLHVAVAFLNRRLIDGRPAISDIVDFSQASDAFRLAGDKRQSMKVQIAFDRELA